MSFQPESENGGRDAARFLIAVCGVTDNSKEHKIQKCNKDTQNHFKYNYRFWQNTPPQSQSNSHYKNQYRYCKSN